MQKTWYYQEGSKKAELWTILHIPYTFMCISFLIVGFAISKPVNITALLLISAAYFLGLGIAAHAFDQLPGQGSSYVQYLKPKELLAMGIVSLMIAWWLVGYFIITWQAWHMIWLMFLQSFFGIAYPVSKLFKGFFHNDFWFAVGFGLMPPIIGFYANTLTLAWIIIPFALVCFLIARIEILLSRFSRKLRAAGMDKKYLQKPEAALKTLCMVTYMLALTMLLL